MKALSITEAVGVYACTREASMTFHQVDFPELGRFSKDLYSFDRALGDMASDEYWAPAIRRLKILRFDLCAAPFPADHIAEYCRTTLAWLREYLRHSTVMYPGHAERALSLAHHLEALCDCGRAPLLEEILQMEAAADTERVGLLVSEPRLIPRAQELVRSHPALHGWEVVGAANLRGEATHERIIAVGAPHWFPEFVFVAPRAREIGIVTYGWIRSAWKPRPAFVAPVSTAGVAKVEGLEPIGQKSEDHGDAELVLPSIDLDRIMQQAVGASSGDDEEEHVDARLHVLDGGWAVLLEADEGASALVLDLDRDVADRVKRVGASDIEPGMYVLLRTSGGGDFIVPVADRILGDLVEATRSSQREWKTRLRGRVKRHGVTRVVKELRRLGSKRANEPNIRNWMSDRSIKTQDYDDFEAILKLVGLGGEADDYWKAMQAIDRAHRKAGFHIRKLLIHEAQQIDLSELERSGFMSIELRDKDAGSLGVFRVQVIVPNVVTVPSQKIGEPFLVDDYGKDVSSQSLLWN